MSDHVGHFIGVVRDDGSKLDFDYPKDYRAFIQTLAGYEVEIDIRKKRTRRTLKQNAFFHAAIAPLAEHLGCTTEELKIDLLGTWFGWKDIRNSKVPERLHTSELNTKDFADLMDHTMQIAAEEGIVILDPSQYKTQKRRREKVPA